MHYGCQHFDVRLVTGSPAPGRRHTGRHVLLAKGAEPERFGCARGQLWVQFTGHWLLRSLARGCVPRAQICDLLLVLAHGDAAVKAALARPGTLRALCAAAARLPAPAQRKCLKCLKHLSGDPGMLEPMQAGAPACSAGRAGLLGARNA